MEKQVNNHTTMKMTVSFNSELVFHVVIGGAGAGNYNFQIKILIFYWV